VDVAVREVEPLERRRARQMLQPGIVDLEVAAAFAFQRVVAVIEVDLDWIAFRRQRDFPADRFNGLPDRIDLPP
jgi:hypothetical protein